MFSIDELFSKRNQRTAFAHLRTKADSIGANGMRVSDFDEYWRLNHEQIEAEIRNGTYQPSVIKNHEVISGQGKKRVISNLAIVDRFITRLLSQKLKRYIEPMFWPNSFAYDEGCSSIRINQKIFIL